MRLVGRLGDLLREQAVARVAAAIAGGLLLGLLIVPRLPEPEDPSAPPPQVMLLGAPLPLDDSAADEALARVRRHVTGTFTVKLPDGVARAFTFAELGVAIDTLRLTELAKDSRDSTSPLRRVWRKADKSGPLLLPVPLVVSTDKATALLTRLKDEFDLPARDARLDVIAGKVSPETRGRSLDVDSTLDDVRRALTAGEIVATASFHFKAPERTAAALSTVKFDQVLGSFETNYDRSENSRARSFNLKLAASKLDGTVLFPGETFDFNDTVGPRDEANGYKVAPVIAQGELVDGIGGGTCQISGTLHGAAFFSGLEIVERYPHTRPSSYIKMGLDAAVVYPTINLRFKNSYTFPIVIHETVDDGLVRAQILGPHTAATVTLIRRIESAQAYDEVDRPYRQLARGQKVLIQRGVPGFKLRRYRIVRDGKHAVRERWLDVYPPTTQIVGVGTGELPASRTPRDDPHPEYLADELLVLTKKAGKHADAADLVETREPGRFGKPGWTKDADMPLFAKSR